MDARYTSKGDLMSEINYDIEQQCQICWSMIMIQEKRCIIHAEKDHLPCILCGAAAEKLGWCISV